MLCAHQLCHGQWACVAHHTACFRGVAGPPVSHHGPGVRTAVPLGQVPQVDGELVEPVVAQVPVGQDAVKEGQTQRALALQGLKERREVTIWHGGLRQARW